MPRIFGGMLSMVRDAPTPHSPPMAKPKAVRSTRRVIRLGEKAEAKASSE